MQLEYFKILNCFGFRDTGWVDLKDERNLIYILGRNSSGKSSILNAIKYYQLGITPSSMPNFVNFDPSTEQPRFVGQFKINKGDLSLEQLIDDLYARYKGQAITSTTITQDPNFPTLFESVRNTYQEFIEQVETVGTIVPVKVGNGNYFLRLHSPHDKLDERQAHINQALTQAGVSKGTAVFRGGSISFDLSFNVMENLLFRQFPNIHLFNEAYSLIDSLPDRLTNNNLTVNAVTKAFVNYLGEEKVRDILNSNQPMRRRKLLSEVQERATELTRRINQYKSESNKDLLEIDLSEHEGLQITIFTDGKTSFYSHISDNTKFLFAYFLYHEDQDISGNVLLFDEPSNGFHPTAQNSLLAFLKSLGAKNNLVVITTHSEYLIDTDNLSGIRIMGKDEEGFPTVKNHFYNQPKGQGDYLALQPIVDAIGLMYGRQLNVRDKVVIAEGVTDMLYLRAFNSILRHESELNVAPARGDSTLLSVIPLLISQGISFKIVIDKGDVMRMIQEAYGVEDDFIYEIQVPALYAGTIGRSGIEDLFSKGDFKNLLTAIGEPVEGHFDKVPNSIYIRDKKAMKRLLAHHLYSHVADYDETKFQAETVENFSKVLDFCKSDEWFAI